MELAERLDEYQGQLAELDGRRQPLKAEIASLEANLATRQEEFKGLDLEILATCSKRDKYIVKQMQEAATQLREKDNQPEPEYSAEQQSEDAQLIAVYESNESLLSKIEGNKTAYQEAKQRQQNAIPLVCPVVVAPRYNEDGVFDHLWGEVYVPVLFEEQEESGLRENLVEAVQAALLTNEGIVFDEPQSEKGIFYLFLPSGQEYFAEALRGMTPEGFTEANVKLEVINPRINLEEVLVDDNNDPADTGRESGDRKLGWIPLEQSTALTGRSASYLRHSDLLDTKGGPIETKEDESGRLLLADSLDKFMRDNFPEYELYITAEAGGVMHKQALELLGESVGVINYRGRLSAMISKGGKIAGIKRGRNMVLSNFCLDRYRVPHFAKEQIKALESDTILITDIARILHVTPSSIHKAVKRSKLEKVGTDRSMRISTKSVEKFLRDHKYYPDAGWRAKDA